MGGRGSWEYAARHPGRFTAVIPMASRVDMDTARAVQAPIFAIHSRDDELVPLLPLQRVMEALKRMGRPAELLVVGGVRHHETPGYRGALARAIPWLKDVWD
jgi:pimeloyl-ACP methyl ester carboxylesterase